MELSKEQQLAFDKYIKGDNIFITGPGGSGKSALIRKIKENCKKEIQVCALTGCAAVLLNCKAKTLHSWSGIGLGNGTIEQNIKKILGSRYKRETWKDTDVLIVDEVSMLSLKLFDMLNEIGKSVRKNPKPFGGIQLIFSGDFYQLPPVGNKDEPDTMRFCFESNNWVSIFSPDCQIQLIKIFRQTDEIYSTILNQIREGRIKKKSNDLLEKYVGREPEENLIVEPTKLFPTKNKVEYINNSKMCALNSEENEYAVKHVFDVEMTNEEKRMRLQYSKEDIQTELDYLTGNLICDKNIKLKVGAQVMCIINIPLSTNDEMICNGSQGIVIRFCSTSNLPIVKYNNGIEMVMGRHIWVSENIPGVGVSQVPLILAWALTIHKSQGATLDTAEIDVGSGIFECGQTYVALSRVKSLNGLYLTSFDARRIKINRKVKEYYEALTLFQEENQKQEENVESILVAIPIAIATLVSTTNEENQNLFSNYNYQLSDK
jgi:ATP-dependent DNA helicase PIF1